MAGDQGQASNPGAARRRDLPVVDLDPPDAGARQLWGQAIVLMRELEGDWTLVGGLMVQLHAARYGAPSIRSTVDIDVLGNSRRRPSVTERIGAKLIELGFEPREQLVDPPTAFRFERDGAIVDLLAPENTGRRNPPRSVGDHQAIAIPGGTQALARSETLLVRLDDEAAEVRCPMLLGAILLKARAIHAKHRDQDREDLVVLLGCVEDPIAMTEELKSGERGWLEAAATLLRLDDGDLGARFGRERLDRARTTFRLLTR